MSIARRLSGPALAVAGTLLMAGCGTLSPAPAQLEAPEASAASEHLSASTFAVTVLAATRRAGSVHTRRIETVRGETTRMIGDTHFGGDRYQGRFTVAIVPRAAARTPTGPRASCDC